MAYVTLEDGTGAIEMLCFTRALEQYGSYLQEGQVIYVTGTLSVRDEKAPQLMCDFARPLNANFSTGTAAPAQAPQQRTGQTLYLRLPSVDGPEMAILRKILYMFEGKRTTSASACLIPASSSARPATCTPRLCATWKSASARKTLW